MTEHDQRIAIAEWMGMDMNYVRPDLERFKNRDDGGEAVFTLARVPDYTRDLNAMHEAERHLGDVNQLNAYADALDKVCVPTHICSLTHWLAVVMATAAQRAEALLRTLNLWRDDPPAPTP